MGEGLRAIRRTDRVLIAGYTGCGKTELAGMISKRATGRLIVWDSKDELQLTAKPVRGLGGLEKALRDGRRIVHWVPLTGSRDEYEQASRLVWRTPGPWLWWVDEASECTSPSWIPTGLKLAATQGRKSGRVVMALTQRVAECHPVLRSQAEHIFLFAELPIEIDLKALAGHMGADQPAIATALEQLNTEHGIHAHLWWVRPTRELRRCAPISLRGPPVTTGNPR
jgi:hypothetical protein